MSMTTKEKIIRASIATAQKELGEIIELLDASPLIEIIECRKKAQELLSMYEVTDPRLAQEIGLLAKKEKRLFKIAEKQKDSIALIDRRVKLEFELAELHNELYWIERKTATQP